MVIYQLAILKAAFLVTIYALENPYKPTPRWANDCALVKGVLYCYGGSVSRQIIGGVEEEQYSSSLYTLDLMKEWTLDDAAWAEVSGDQTVALAYFTASSVPSDANSFLVHGGKTNGVRYQTMIYDTLQKAWIEPMLQGPWPLQRVRHTAATDNQGRIWIWGGKSVDSATSYEIYDNRWAVIDTSAWTYNYPDIPNPPSARIDHTATLIPDGTVIIIGGLVYSRNLTDPSGETTLNPVSMSSLLKFDAASSQWQNVTATGNIPAPRGGHSAVLSGDGSYIIVFGGSFVDGGQPVYLNDVFVLELSTMRWTSPSLAGTAPSPRTYHYARLVDEHMMLVAFGLNEGQGATDILGLLNTSSWSWVDTYTPNKEWLLYKANSTAGGDGKQISTITATTSIPPPVYSNSTIESHRNRTLAGGDKNNTGRANNDHDSSDEEQALHLRFGVVAGVISGSVVVVGVGIFLFFSAFVVKRRKRKEAEQRESICLESPATLKPDNRSSLQYVSQADGHQRKPDEKD